MAHRTVAGPPWQATREIGARNDQQLERSPVATLRNRVAYVPVLAGDRVYLGESRDAELEHSEAILNHASRAADVGASGDGPPGSTGLGRLLLKQSNQKNNCDEHSSSGTVSQQFDVTEAPTHLIPPPSAPYPPPSAPAQSPANTRARRFRVCGGPAPNPERRAD